MAQFRYSASPHMVAAAAKLGAEGVGEPCWTPLVGLVGPLAKMGDSFILLGSVSRDREGDAGGGGGGFMSVVST